MDLTGIVPDVQVFLGLQPEEVGAVLLEHLNSLNLPEGQALNRFNDIRPDDMTGYSHEYRGAVSNALMEGWLWLEREGLLAPKPDRQGDWYFITRRGRALTRRTDVEAFKHANLLPRDLLHADIAAAAYPAFLRGEYDTAVFQAFRDVEVAVRHAGKFGPNDFGTALMRRAFDPNNGPLTDQTLPMPEREALAHLFAGAIGRYKNPTSHRQVAITAEEAVELIVFASHLRRLV